MAVLDYKEGPRISPVDYCQTFTIYHLGFEGTAPLLTDSIVLQLVEGDQTELKAFGHRASNYLTNSLKQVLGPW